MKIYHEGTQDTKKDPRNTGSLWMLLILLPLAVAQGAVQHAYPDVIGGLGVYFHPMPEELLQLYGIVAEILIKMRGGGTKMKTDDENILFFQNCHGLLVR